MHYIGPLTLKRSLHRQHHRTLEGLKLIMQAYYRAWKIVREAKSNTQNEFSHRALLNGARYHKKKFSSEGNEVKGTRAAEERQEYYIKRRWSNLIKNREPYVYCLCRYCTCTMYTGHWRNGA